MPPEPPVETVWHPAPPPEEGRLRRRLEAIGRLLGAEIRPLRPSERPGAIRRALDAAAAEIERPGAAPRPEEGDRLRPRSDRVRREEPG
jgi:hypothetical protein